MIRKVSTVVWEALKGRLRTTHRGSSAGDREAISASNAVEEIGIASSLSHWSSLLTIPSSSKTSDANALLQRSCPPYPSIQTYFPGSPAELVKPDVLPKTTVDYSSGIGSDGCCSVAPDVREKYNCELTCDKCYQCSIHGSTCELFSDSDVGTPAQKINESSSQSCDVIVNDVKSASVQCASVTTSGSQSTANVCDEAQDYDVPVTSSNVLCNADEIEPSPSSSNDVNGIQFTNNRPVTPPYAVGSADSLMSAVESWTQRAGDFLKEFIITASTVQEDHEPDNGDIAAAVHVHANVASNWQRLTEQQQNQWVETICQTMANELLSCTGLSINMAKKADVMNSSFTASRATTFTQINNNYGDADVQVAVDSAAGEPYVTRVKHNNEISMFMNMAVSRSSLSCSSPKVVTLLPECSAQHRFTGHDHHVQPQKADTALFENGDGLKAVRKLEYQGSACGKLQNLVCTPDVGPATAESQDQPSADAAEGEIDEAVAEQCQTMCGTVISTVAEIHHWPEGLRDVGVTQRCSSTSKERGAVADTQQRPEALREFVSRQRSSSSTDEIVLNTSECRSLINWPAKHSCWPVDIEDIQLMESVSLRRKPPPFSDDMIEVIKCSAWKANKSTNVAKMTVFVPLFGWECVPCPFDVAVTSYVCSESPDALFDWRPVHFRSKLVDIGDDFAIFKVKDIVLPAEYGVDRLRIRASLSDGQYGEWTYVVLSVTRISLKEFARKHFGRTNCCH